jgi:hypothetical protein
MALALRFDFLCLCGKAAFQERFNSREEYFGSFDLSDMACLFYQQHAGIWVAGRPEFGCSLGDDIGGAVYDQNGRLYRG